LITYQNSKAYDEDIQTPALYGIMRMMKRLEKIKKILAEYKPALSKEFKVKEIGVFGSYLQGKEKSESDLDILVTFSQPISLLDLVKLENYLTSLIGIKVDVVPKEDIRPELKKEILGQAIYV